MIVCLEMFSWISLKVLSYNFTECAHERITVNGIGIPVREIKGFSKWVLEFQTFTIPIESVIRHRVHDLFVVDRNLAANTLPFPVIIKNIDILRA